MQLQGAHFLTVQLGNKGKLSAQMFGSGNTTIMQNHELPCFGTDMEMLFH